MNKNKLNAAKHKSTPRSSKADARAGKTAASTVSVLRTAGFGYCCYPYFCFTAAQAALALSA
jgi:hypothetical protein